MNIHIHIEDDEKISNHTWNPTIDINQLIDWWHTLNTEDIHSIIQSVKTIGKVVKSNDLDPDPRWCLFVSSDEIHFSLGDKYFTKEAVYGI